jgi:hypothetical protein
MANHMHKIRAFRQEAPCVSIYLDMRHGRMPEQLASVALFHELRYARRLLESSMSARQAQEYVRPLLRAARNELLSEKPRTLGLFLSGEAVDVVPLSRRAKPVTIVADRFHVRPLAAGKAAHDPPVTEAVTSLFGIAQALKAKRARKLWLAEDVVVWGLLSRKHGTAVLHPRQMNDRDGDVLDDLFEWALDEGVETSMLPIDRMPGRSPAIAVLKTNQETESS